MIMRADEGTDWTETSQTCMLYCCFDDNEGQLAVLNLVKIPTPTLRTNIHACARAESYIMIEEVSRTPLSGHKKVSSVCTARAALLRCISCLSLPGPVWFPDLTLAGWVWEPDYPAPTSSVGVHALVSSSPTSAEPCRTRPRVRVSV